MKAASKSFLRSLAKMRDKERNEPSPILCEHANEVPMMCPCEPGCCCKANTCGMTRKRFVKSLHDKRDRRSTTLLTTVGKAEDDERMNQERGAATERARIREAIGPALESIVRSHPYVRRDAIRAIDNATKPPRAAKGKGKSK